MCLQPKAGLTGPGVGPMARRVDRGNVLEGKHEAMRKKLASRGGRCHRAASAPEALRENPIPRCFQLSLATHIPGLVAPSATCRASSRHAPLCPFLRHKAKEGTK